MFDKTCLNGVTFPPTMSAHFIGEFKITFLFPLGF